MTKKIRTTLFLACLFAFILIAPSIVLYSQGYRIDFDPPANGKRITQTGGLFLKVVPKQTDIYIDGKLKKRTDFFFGSVLIENLIPKKYKVEIKKSTGQEEYYPWGKTLEINEKQVTEAKNVVLFPKNINFNVLSVNAEQVWLSPDQKKIILKEKEQTGWSLKLYDLEKNIKSHLISEDDFFTKEPQLISLEFSEDSRNLYLKANIKEEIKDFTLNLDSAKPALIEREPMTLPVKNAVLSQQAGNDIYYLNNLGYLFRNEEKLSETPFPVKQETEYYLEILNGNIFLEENETLYKFNYDKKSFENFFEGIKLLQLSPDNKKLLYSSNNEIWILFLSDKIDQPQKKTGEKLFLIRLSDAITDVSWINDNYLALISGNVIKITEIDERDKLNIIDIFETKKLPQEGSVNKMFWNQFDDKIYLLNENGYLYGSNVLLP